MHSSASSADTIFVFLIVFLFLLRIFQTFPQMFWFNLLSVAVITTKIMIDNTDHAGLAEVFLFRALMWFSCRVCVIFSECICARLCSWLTCLCVSHYFPTLWSRVSHRHPSTSPSLSSPFLFFPFLLLSFSLTPLSLSYPSFCSSLHLYSVLQPQLLPSQLCAFGWSPCCTWHVLWDPGATLDVWGPDRPPPREGPCGQKLRADEWEEACGLEKDLLEFWE